MSRASGLRRAQAPSAVAVILGALLSSSALAQTASLLPNGMQQFADGNGVPYVGGKVYFYTPNTTNGKGTWQDPAQQVPNTNPVVLDSAGRATIYGAGQYRQVLYDQFGNLIWDKLTNGGAGGGAGSATNCVNDSGADPTGSRDSTSALNACFAAKCYAYVPAGTYLTSAAVTTGSCTAITIQGAGSSITTISSNNAGAETFRNNATEGYISGLTFDRSVPSTSAYGVDMSVLTDQFQLVDVKSRNSCYGFYLGATAWSWLKQVEADNNYCDGVYQLNSYIANGVQWNYDGVLSQGNNGWGIDTRSVSGAGGGAVQVGVWNNVTTFANTNGGVLFQAGSSSNPLEGIRITNSSFQGDGNDEMQLQTYAAGMMYVSNTIIDFAGTGSTGRGQSTAASHTGNGINVVSEMQGLSLHQVKIENNSLNGVEIGQIASSTSAMTLQLDLAGDYVANNGQAGTGHVGLDVNGTTGGATIITGGFYGNRSGSTAQAYGVKLLYGDNTSLASVNVLNNTTAGINIANDAANAYCFGIVGEPMTTIGCNQGGGGGTGVPGTVAGVGAGTNVNITGTAANPVVNVNTAPSFAGQVTATAGINMTTAGTSELCWGPSTTANACIGLFSGGIFLGQNAAAVTMQTNLLPSVDATGESLGTATERFNGIYSMSGTFYGPLTTNITTAGCVTSSATGVLSGTGAPCGGGGTGTTPPGGSTGQIQYNNGGAFGGFTASGDATIVPTTGVVTVTKTNGVALGTAATYNVGTSGATIPLLSTANTFAGAQTFSGGITTNVTGTATQCVQSTAAGLLQGTGAPCGTGTGGGGTLTGVNAGSNISVTGAAPAPTVSVINSPVFTGSVTSGTQFGFSGTNAPFINFSGTQMWLQLLGSAATQLVMNAPAGSAFVPGSSNSYDLGGGSNLWRNIYAGGTLTAAVGSFSGNVTTSGGSFTCSSANCGLTMGGGTTSYVSGSGTGDMWLQGPTNVTVNASNSFVPANDNATKLGIPGQAWQSVALSNSGQIFLGTVSGAVLWGDSGGAIHLGAGGSGSILISTAAGAGMLPYGDNTTILGSGSNRWSVVYAANGTIQTSDAREKDNIKDSDLGLDFINQLHPVSFIWKQHPGKTPDTHRHYGLLAQEMDEELAGRDFGGLKAPANDNERYGLNYDELIGPLIKAVQQLSQENHILKVRLDRLEHERIAPGRRASND